MSRPKTQHAQLLHAWFSPSMPTGAYAYSHGLEAAIATEQVRDADTLSAWVTRVLVRGSGRNDACLLAAAWRAEHRADTLELDEVDALARALVASHERLAEGLAQGRSFARAAANWVDISAADEQRMLAVTTGALTARIGLPLESVLIAAAQAFVTNLVWIGARLIPIGQDQALGVISQLLPTIQNVATSAGNTSLDSLGSATPLADIASMRHQHQSSRVCLS